MNLQEKSRVKRALPHLEVIYPHIEVVLPQLEVENPHLEVNGKTLEALNLKGCSNVSTGLNRF